MLCFFYHGQGPNNCIQATATLLKKIADHFVLSTVTISLANEVSTAGAKIPGVPGGRQGAGRSTRVT